MAEKAAETEEAVAEVTAETVVVEMAENVIEKVAETEIVTMKTAETEEVVKSVDNFRDYKKIYIFEEKKFDPSHTKLLRSIFNNFFLLNP